MDVWSRALLLLSATVFFTIADTQDFSEYEEFEGLFESFVEDLEKLIAKYRRISMTGGALKAKQRDETGSSAYPPEQTITFVTKIDESSIDPSSSIAGYNTVPVETSTEETACSYTVISGSASGYITTESATAKQTVTSTSGTLSQTAHSSSSEGYSTVDAMTEDTAISTSKSDGSYEIVSISSSVSTAAEEQTATFTQKFDSSSADSTGTPGIYSTAALAAEEETATFSPKSNGSSTDPSQDHNSTASPVAEEETATFSPKSDGSCVAPSSSTARYSTVAPAAEPKEVSSESACSFTESCDPPSINHPLRVGSIRGIPGEHFPNYTDIPITDFSCLDKLAVPGFYADMDAGCQVFHVCWSDRQETFLCPVGTTFNQAILACDYWYSNNCSLAPQYYSVNMGDTGLDSSEVGKQESVSSMIDTLLESRTLDPSEVAYTLEKELDSVSAISFLSKFLPVKAKVTLFTESTEPYYETTQSFDDKDTSTNDMLPKAEVSISHRYGSQTVFDGSSEDPMEAAIRQSFEEALQEAKKVIDDLEERLEEAWTRLYDLGMLILQSDDEGIQQANRGQSDTVRARLALLDQIGKFTHLTKLMGRQKGSKAESDGGFDDGTQEVDQETAEEMKVCNGVRQRSYERKLITEDPTIETVAPLANPMDSEITTPADLEHIDDLDERLEEAWKRLFDSLEEKVKSFIKRPRLEL